MKSNTIYPPMSEREISGAAISREAATQGMVLLKNINGVLPLKGRGKIALFGNGAARTIRGGTGSGDPFNGGLSGGGDQDVDQSLRYHINILNAMETEGFEIVNREQQMAWARCYDLAKREMKDQVMSVFAFPEEPLASVCRMVKYKTSLKQDQIKKQASARGMPTNVAIPSSGRQTVKTDVTENRNQPMWASSSSFSPGSSTTRILAPRARSLSTMSS